MYNRNKFFNQEKAEYLICNGFEESRSEVTTTVHFKDTRKGLLLSVNENHIDLFDCKGKLMLLHSFSGIDRIDIVKFMMLLHIIGAIPLKEFVANVKKANAFPVADLFIDDNNSVHAYPVNY